MMQDQAISLTISQQSPLLTLNPLGSNVITSNSVSITFNILQKNISFLSLQLSFNP